MQKSAVFLAVLAVFGMVSAAQGVGIKPGAPALAYEFNEGTGDTLSPLAPLMGPIANRYWNLKWDTDTAYFPAGSNLGRTGLAGDHCLTGETSAGNEVGNVHIPQAFAVGSAATFSMWLYCNSLNADSGRAFFSSNSGGGGNGGTGGMTGGTPMLMTRVKNTGGTFGAPYREISWNPDSGESTTNDEGAVPPFPTTQDNAWHQLTVVWDRSGSYNTSHVGARWFMYWDGADITSYSDPDVSYDPGTGIVYNSLKLFENGTHNTPYNDQDYRWTSRIDDFAAWHYALSADEVAWLADSANTFDDFLIPEPASIGLLGVTLLAIRKRRS